MAVIRAVVSAALLASLFGCEYAGHTVKAQLGRAVGETIKGSEYSIGCEVRFDKRR